MPRSDSHISWAMPTLLTTIAVTIGLSITSVSAEDSRNCFVRANASSDPTAVKTDLLRARNLARQAAESYNGGLQLYRAEDSMHARIAQAPCRENDDGTWTFTFKGNRPGNTVPFVETVVTVDRRGWRISVDDNRILR